MLFAGVTSLLRRNLQAVIQDYISIKSDNPSPSDDMPSAIFGKLNSHAQVHSSLSTPPQL
jgi:hypothetical protein